MFQKTPFDIGANNQSPTNNKQDKNNTKRGKKVCQSKQFVKDFL